MKKCIASLFLGLIVAGLSLATARAEDQVAPKPTTEVVKAGEVALNIESLRALLEGMGYDTDKPVKDKEGKILGFSIKIDTGKYTTYPSILLSNDMTNLWMTINLSKIEDPGTASGKVLLDLLAANDKVFPNYFCYVPSNNFLYLKSFIPNKGIKAKDLASRLKMISQDINAFDTLWDATKWTTKTK